MDKKTTEEALQKTGKGLKGVVGEFKEFISKGNVLDMAVGVVIGGAFTAIVNSLVNDIINPSIGLFFNADFSDVVIPIGDVGIGVGAFLNAIINFLIVAFVLFLTIKAKPYKTAVSVSTVVIFGTISMFLYPFLYRNGFCALTPDQMGIYTGATLHEVAHVVGAGDAMGNGISDSAIIVKMIRVMMLVPVLLITTYLVARARKRQVQKGQKFQKIAVPWFAIGFMGVIAFNSFDLLPAQLVAGINTLDTFLLTMAMTALGTETSIDKFRKAGAKPFVLALLLYVWLVVGGYFLVKYLTPYLM